MSEEAIDRLAHAYGIEPGYVSATGEHRATTVETKQALLAAMGVAADTDADMKSALAGAAAGAPQSAGDTIGTCFLPQWLQGGRCWGIACQLYGLKSERNQGIGDFEDLARLAELGARAGADFIGINPLHALFWSDPQRCSPYAPSSRRFLNPLYIALDNITGTGTHGALAMADAETRALRAADTVDYAAVAGLKRAVLQQAFAHASDCSAFRRFRDEGGEALKHFAQFEALSEAMAMRGHGAGWHGWPRQYRDCRSAAVAAFAARHADRVLFHQWLQWIASEQLSLARARARAAGMRIGLYADLAVGVAPDGMATWSDPDLFSDGASIGAPPDPFNADGQDWGLAPMSARKLEERGLKPFAEDVAAAMRHAGAIRIDHAMGLMRLYWIPTGLDARRGGYVRYPLGGMVSRLKTLSNSWRAVVIGEDLGTVPAGLRDVMRMAEIHSYRVLYFERHLDGSFVAPEHYPRGALATIATHDLPTLAGWWLGRDIAARSSIGLYAADDCARAREGRRQDRQRLCAALFAAGVGKADLEQGASVADAAPEGLALAVHRYLARTPSRLLAVQLEDLLGIEHQANLPGSAGGYPNWRRRLAINLGAIASQSGFCTLTQAVARERPR